MRQRELQRLQDQVVIDKQVDVDDTWSVAHTRRATQRALQTPGRPQQLQRAQRRLARARKVVEVRLIGQVQRRRLVNRGDARDADQRGEGGEGGAQVRRAVAQVAAQSQIDRVLALGLRLWVMWP